MLRLALSYLWDRRLNAALNILLVAIAVAMLTTLLLFSIQMTNRFQRDAEGVDLVVGAKGSPLQLILSSIFHIDQPTGNIPVESIDLLRRDPAIARVIPLALGDNFRGFRIVGTEPSYLDLQRAKLAKGRLNTAEGEAVIGAEVARQTGADLGQRFYGSHGLGEAGAEHAHQPFTVVGILEKSGGATDRLIVTSVETVWSVHGVEHDHDEDASHEADHADAPHRPHDHDHDHEHGAARAGLQERSQMRPEVTALLVTYRNASAAIRVPAVINRQTQLQAAVPATETARLLSLFGASLAGAQIFAWLLAMIGGLSIFVALLNAVQTRAADLGLLRVMGARRSFVFGAMVFEGLIIGALGVAAGMVMGHALLWFATQKFSALASLGFDPLLLHPGALVIAVGVIAIAGLSALLPAIRVYSGDAVRILSRST
jgi:putative ABC transport system permease protein